MKRQRTKILGYWNGMATNGRDILVTAATQDGRTLISYFVPDEKTGAWALGMDGTNRNNWQKYYEMVGPFEVEWVPFAQTTTHIGLQRMLQAYRERMKNEAH